MDNNSIAILQDYESSIESSFKKMEKSAKSFEGSDQSQQNLIITTLNNELGTAKTNIGLMKMELSNLKEEGNISKWQEIINELQKTHDSFKAQMIQMRNKKNSMNDDPSNLDVRVDMSKMSSQQVMNRGDDLLNADREAISRIKNVVNQDLDTMKEVNKELLSQNEKLENADKDLKEIDYSLNRAGKQIKTMAKMYATDKLVMCMILCILIVIIAIVIMNFIITYLKVLYYDNSWYTEKYQYNKSHIYKETINKSSFNNIVGKHPKAHKATIEYLRNHDQDDVLRGYLGSKGDYEELLYMTLENFFKCKTIKDRKGYIIEAKKYLELIKGNSNLDFYKQYINDLENSLKFKKACIDKAKIIPANSVSLFDNSIFECYKLGVDSNYDFIESNNKNFNIGQKKVSYIRFKTLAEKKKFDQIKEILANTNYKKLDISPFMLAKIMYNARNYDFAVELIKQSTDFNEFDEKIDLLRKMQKHRVALEIVLNEKKADKNRYINELLREKPDLKKDLQELQNKPK